MITRKRNGTVNSFLISIIRDSLKHYLNKITYIALVVILIQIQQVTSRFWKNGENNHEEYNKYTRDNFRYNQK